MSHTSFLGIPVEGDITHVDRKHQRPLVELEPLLRAVLDDPTIVEFGWVQRTPYFNDGEPCTFSAFGLWVRTDADAPAPGYEDEDEDDLTVEYGHPSLGEFEWDYYGTAVPRQRRVKSYTGPDRERLEHCLGLNSAIDGGEFDNVLLESFGDHARVTVTRDGITVHFYEHD